MKFTEFEKETRITDFAKRCLLDTNYNEKGERFRMPINEWTRKCWRKAKTFEEFVELFFSADEEEIVRSYGYCELSKTLNAKAHEKRFNRMLSNANRAYYTMSDIGSLKIGNSNFTMLVPNSYGDGETKVFVFKKGNENFIYNMLNIHDWRCSCKGKIDIYHYDCGDDICATLEGSYSIYSENGNVIFVEYEDLLRDYMCYEYEMGCDDYE